MQCRTSTSDSTAHAERESIHKHIKEDVTSLVGLLEWLLERPIVIEVLEDTKSAIQVAKEAYSSRLWQLGLHNRVNVGWLRLFFSEKGNLIRHADNASHRGDVMTKELNAERFTARKKLVSIGVS